MMRILVMIICLSLVALPGVSLAKDGGGKGVGKKSGMKAENGPSPSDSAYENASDKARFMRNESLSPYENREGPGDRDRYEGGHNSDRSKVDDDDQQKSKDKSKEKNKKKQKGEDEAVNDDSHKRHEPEMNHEHEMEHEYHGEDQMREHGDKER